MHKIFSFFLMGIMLSSVLASAPIFDSPKAFAQTSDEITDISNYVVYGLEKVEIDNGVTIQSGNIGLHDNSKKKGELKIKKDVEFVDPEISIAANKIKIEKNAVAPNVYYNELKNKGTILGTENTPLALPVVNNLPEFPDFEAGDENITVDKNKSMMLSPGDYGKIKLKKNSIIIFEGGIYNIKSIKADKDSQILFSDSSEVRVKKDIKLDKQVTLGPHPDSEINASDIIFFVGDDKKSKIEFGKNSVIYGKFFSPNGEIKMKKETQATGSFIAKTVKIDKNSNITLDSSSDIPIEDLVDEYLELIEKLDVLGSDIDETEITQEFIDEIQNDLDSIKQIVIEFQMRGFDGEGTASRINEQTIGNVLFFDENTGNELFNIVIPNGTLTIFAIFGYIEEFEGTISEFTLPEKIALINDSLAITEILTNSDDEEIATTFVLAAIGAYHPSTGNTFVIVGFFIYFAVMQCLANPACVDAVNQVVQTVVSLVLDETTPIILIVGEEFNDLNNDGNKLGADEIGVGGFEYLLGASGPIIKLSENPTESSSQGDFSFKFRIAKTISNLVVVQSERDGWMPNIDGNIRDLSFVEPSQNLQINLDPSFGNLEIVSSPPPTPGIFFEDDYSSNDGWTQVLSCLGCRPFDNPDFSGRGTLTVDDPSFPGIVKFNQVQGGFGVFDHRVFKQLPSALPADNWTAEIDYIFTSSNQVLSHPLVFTVTSEHLELQHPSERLTITQGTGIDQIHINTIRGSTDDIPLTPNTQYYLSLERSPTELVLSAFSDPERTIHVPGSPVNINILATDYTDLNFIQHSHTLGGGKGRILTAEVDNTQIFGIITTPPPPPPPPSNIFFEDDYSSNSGWTQSGSKITVDDPSFPGVVRFDEASGGAIDHRVFKQLPSVLPADNWTAEMDYRIITNSPLVNHYPLAFTTTSEHPEKQNQSGDVLRINHGLNTDQIHLSTVSGDSANIPLSRNIQYHLSLERTPTELVLSVFFDPARTLEVSGSPVSINILATDYTDLEYIQHSASFFSGGARKLSAEVDNTQIFD